MRPTEQRGLARWGWGTLRASSACLNAVATELLVHGWTWAAACETLRAGPERAAPWQPTLDVATCFAPLLSWVLRRCVGRELALALDATAHGEARVLLAISVLYQSRALPVAWATLPGKQPTVWGPH